MKRIRRRAARKGAKRLARKREGIALLIAMGAIAILTIMVADLHETTGTGYAVALSQRDGLRAEMLALSGLDLTRLLVSQEPPIRQTLAPLLQNIPIGGLPPQLPVWNIAGSVLAPFCNYEGVREGSAIDFNGSQGLGDLPGRCEIVAVADSLDAEMIVIGSRGRGPFTAKILGSVSQGVLAETRRPVLVVRGVHDREPAPA